MPSRKGGRSKKGVKGRKKSDVSGVAVDTHPEVVVAHHVDSDTLSSDVDDLDDGAVRWNMPSRKGGRSRKGVKGRKKSDVSGVAVDTHPEVVVAHHVDSDALSSDVDDLDDGAGVLKEGSCCASVMSLSDTDDLVWDDWVGELKKIYAGLMDIVDKSDVDLVRKVLDQGSKYEVLLIKLMRENEYLKAQVEVYKSGAVSFMHPVPLAVDMPDPVVPAVEAPVANFDETWSEVVRGNGGASSEEAVRTVEKEIGPTLGVRVDGTRAKCDGAAVISTPFVEMEKYAADVKSAELGLEVAACEKLGSRIVVQRVHSELSTTEFMEDLYEMNLVGTCTQEAFGECVRLVNRPWKVVSGGRVNVVLECSGPVAEKLCREGVYVKWFRFAARLQDPVPACHRCLGFDHWVRQCRFKQDVCRHCGLSGHIARSCPNPVRCRNCELKGHQADHSMFSLTCPVYAALAARASARR